jgi:hypothetical protein
MEIRQQMVAHFDANSMREWLLQQPADSAASTNVTPRYSQ